MKKLFYLLIASPALLFAQPNDTIITLNNGVRIKPIDSDFWNAPFKERIGQKAIPFNAKDSEGRRHTSDQYLGKVQIVAFWNIWDWDGCEKQVKALNRIAEKYWKDVAVISFVRENMGLEEFAFLQEHPVRFPIIPQSFDFGMQYHEYQFGVPLFFFIDKQGVWQHIGRNPDDFEKWVIEMIQR
jgi:peroxiredoxin